MKIEYEKNALIVLVGAMGTGKSTFTRKHFFAHDIVETDFIRRQLSGNSEEQFFNKTVFEILYATIEARAKAGIFTVIDSTGSNSVLEHVKQIGKKYNTPLIIIKFPHLTDKELIPERMQHRMKVLHIYHNQVKRIDESIFAKEYTVYDLTKDDVNNTIFVMKKNLEHYLDSSKKYVVVPDIHGEFSVVEELLNRYYNDTTINFIFLGDLIDRGESSYKTFLLVRGLIDEGRAFAVSSNHDYKLSRYMRKWKLDTNKEKYLEISEFDFPNSYGMHLSHGLGGTVREFYSLSSTAMDEYADDFISYFDATSAHLILVRGDTIHYFTHAGISHNAARGFDITNSDRDTAMFKAIIEVSDVADKFKFEIEKTVILNVGHNYMYDEPALFMKDNYGLYMHDVGIGKTSINITDVVDNFIIL